MLIKALAECRESFRNLGLGLDRKSGLSRLVAAVTGYDVWASLLWVLGADDIEGWSGHACHCNEAGPYVCIAGR